MPYTSPPTVATGTPIRSAAWGNIVKGSLDFLANPPACRVYHSTGQNAGHNTSTALTFNSERYDTDSMHSAGSATRITFNTAGLYLINGLAGFAGATDFDYVNLGVRLNGATYIAFDSYAESSVSHPPRLAPTTVYKFAAADYIELVIFQFNGAGTTRSVLGADTAGNFSAEFAAAYTGLG